MLQSLPFNNPAAKLLEVPLTLLWALQQAQICFAGHFRQVMQCTTVHFVGAQKEIGLWPVFLELLPLMPYQHMQLHLISPDIPNDMHGSCQTFTLQQHSASQSSHIQQDNNSPDSAVQSAWDPSTLNSVCSHQKQAVEESDLPAQHAGQHHIAVPSQKHHAAVDRQQHPALQASEEDEKSQSLQLSFHTGCYHDAASSLWQEHGRPDLVFGANAGLAAYTSWLPTLQLLSQDNAPPAIFTDFCEEAAYQGVRVMQHAAQGPMQWMPISVNPFRSPVSCQGKHNNLPSYSNAFMFGMAPAARDPVEPAAVGKA